MKLPTSRSGRVARGAVTAALACTCTLVASGCSAEAATSRAQAPQPEAQQQSQQAQQQVTQAMVVVLEDGTALFVDTDTNVPYLPLVSDDALVVDADGNQLGLSGLRTGNVVSVTGDGAMLQSYPAQYPGISRVELVEQGAPEDAERYHELVNELEDDVAALGVPTAVVEYESSLGKVDAFVTPLGDDWCDDPQAALSEACQADASALHDITVDGPTRVELDFDADPTLVIVTRVADGSPAGSAEAVQTTVVDGDLTLEVEPGYRYLMSATFAHGRTASAFLVRTA